MAETGTDISKAKTLLEGDELVAIPTETVYGLAANALHAAAVTKIFQVKNRPKFDPLIVHIAHAGEINCYARDIPTEAIKLADHFWPGPLTLVLKKKDLIPDIVTAGLDTVGIRCPDHPLTAALLQGLGFPLAAPSANPFGYVSPTTASHVDEQLGNKIPYILDGGNCAIGIESTIVGFENDVPTIYRMGGVSAESIEAVIGEVKVLTNSTSNPISPGQLKSHYAPGKKVIIGKIEELLQEYPAHCSGLLTFTKDFNSPYQYILAPTHNSLEEAAQNLFAGLRFFDKVPVNVVLTELLPNEGLGRAINDRLLRAAALEI
jgi:L-threonylcarbamoyladenylate synthase